MDLASFARCGSNVEWFVSFVMGFNPVCVAKKKKKKSNELLNYMNLTGKTF